MMKTELEYIEFEGDTFIIAPDTEMQGFFFLFKKKGSMYEGGNKKRISYGTRKECVINIYK